MSGPAPGWRIFTDIGELLTMDGQGGSAEGRLGLIPDAAMVVDDAGVLRWIGPARELPGTRGGGTEIALGAGVVMPALVDPHTHLVFAGDRAADFSARCAGESYEAIASRGGGIRTTVAATRAASAEALTALALPRLLNLLREGVLTVEIKSGYGLDIETELRQLEVIKGLAGLLPQRLIPTLLLHMPPPDGQPDWLEQVERTLMPRALGLAKFVDVFVEKGAYTPAQGERLLRLAKRLGLGLKAHTEQLHPSGFGAIAAALGATSLEHLEWADGAVLDAMQAAGTVAVLLPGASVFLGDAARPPVAELRDRGIPMALGTDLNPGSSACANPWLIATLACTQYGLQPAEALLGLTRAAADAVLAGGVAGRIAVGRRADFVTSRLPTWAHLLYGLGHHPVAAVYRGGVQIAPLSLDLPFV